MRFSVLAFFSFLIAFPLYSGEFISDVELNYVFPGENEIRIPGTEEGTLFYANEIGEANSTVTGRLRLGWRSDDYKHEVFALAAPLYQEWEGTEKWDSDSPLRFFGKSFGNGEVLNLGYQFNSYRLGYRYTFYMDDSWRLAGGAALKIRDAYIEVSNSEGKSSRKDDFGFVPLLTFLAQYQVSDEISLLLDADGLASPQGRAFDVLIGASTPLQKISA